MGAQIHQEGIEWSERNPGKTEVEDFAATTRESIKELDATPDIESKLKNMDQEWPDAKKVKESVEKENEAQAKKEAELKDMIVATLSSNELNAFQEVQQKIVAKDPSIKFEVLCIATIGALLSQNRLSDETLGKLDEKLKPIDKNFRSNLLNL